MLYFLKIYNTYIILLVNFKINYKNVERFRINTNNEKKTET